MSVWLPALIVFRVAFSGVAGDRRILYQIAVSDSPGEEVLSFSPAFVVSES